MNDTEISDLIEEMRHANKIEKDGLMMENCRALKHHIARIKETINNIHNSIFQQSADRKPYTIPNLHSTPEAQILTNRGHQYGFSCVVEHENLHG